MCCKKSRQVCIHRVPKQQLKVQATKPPPEQQSGSPKHLFIAYLPCFKKAFLGYKDCDYSGDSLPLIQWEVISGLWAAWTHSCERDAHLRHADKQTKRTNAATLHPHFPGEWPLLSTRKAQPDSPIANTDRWHCCQNFYWSIFIQSLFYHKCIRMWTAESLSMPGTRGNQDF